MPGVPSEFVPLSEWMRQSTIFNVLTSIRFFKFYLVNKCFSSWRNNVRYKLYCQQRKKLINRLFLAKESFCNPLLEIKKAMLEMQGVDLMDLRTQKVYEVMAFVDHQNHKRVDSSKQFDECMTKMQAIVEKVCTDVSNLAKSTDNYEALFDGRGGGLSIQYEKCKSMVSAKQEQADRKRMLRRAAQEARMLVDFIRLSDYIAFENLVQLTIQTNNDFLQELQKYPRKTGLFETSVLFHPNQQTTFQPTCHYIQSTVAQITEAMISTVNSVSRILYSRPFNQYVAGVVSHGPQVASTIKASLEFQRIRTAIDDKIQLDFEDASDYVKIFDNVRAVYDHDLEWDFTQYARQSHSVNSIKSDMAQVSGWEKELEKMRVGNVCGILHVESRKLKQTLMPMVSEKLDQMKSLVRDLARAKCREQLVDFKQRIQMILQRPQHLKEFASYVEKLNGLKSKNKSLQKNTAVVDEMYRLLSSYGVRISSEDMVQVDDLNSVKDKYRTEVEDADAFVDDRKSEMISQLDTCIARLNEQLTQVATQLQQGNFVDYTYISQPKQILEELSQYRQKLDNFEQLSKQYSTNQELFQINVHSYKNLAKTQDTFNQIDTLWKNIDSWNSSFESWRENDFRTLDIEQMNKEVMTHFKDIFSAHKKLNNKVTEIFKEQVTELKNKMPLLLELGNPAMQERHWERIFKELNLLDFVGQPFSLNQLVENDIFEYAALVTEVSGTASGEAQLEESLEIIAAAWEDQNFITCKHRDTKDVYILGGLDDIVALLEDNQVTLQTMMGSRYVTGVKHDVEKWEKKLSLLSETLDEWVTCQKNWMYLETIFCAEDIQKQLPAETTKFQIVDKTWKSILLNTHQQPNVIRCVEDGPQLLEQFQQCNKSLEEIQKSLEDYLETKRMAFPRFYFLSNDELLEILSQTRDPKAVQPHLMKCFDAMKSIAFGEGGDDSKSFSGMKSPEGEYVQFPQVGKAEGPVEGWLATVELRMRESLYHESKMAHTNYPKGDKALDRREWLFQHPAQVIIMVDQIYWTAGLTDALVSAESGCNPNAVKVRFKSDTCLHVEHGI
jgi:dynein heavy chain